MKPDFLGIGAVKSGSGWLYKNLKTQPRMWLPPIKEIHYFDLINRKVPRVTENAISLRKSKRMIGNLKRSSHRWGDFEKSWFKNYYFKFRNAGWYCSLFPNDPDLIKGEITPQYASINLQAIEAVYRINPEMKLIYCLRDPIERTLSHMRMQTFQARKSDINRILNKQVLVHNDYVSNLKRWCQYFDGEKILVLYYEELVDDPRSYLDRVSKFLGNSEDLIIEMNKFDSRPNSFDTPIDRTLKTKIARASQSLIESQHRYFNNHFTKLWVENMERLLA